MLNKKSMSPKNILKDYKHLAVITLRKKIDLAKFCNDLFKSFVKKYAYDSK